MLIKGDSMARNDVFKQAGAKVALTGRAASFNNAMQKCNIAKEFAVRGVNVKDNQII